MLNSVTNWEVCVGLSLATFLHPLNMHFWPQYCTLAII